MTFNATEYYRGWRARNPEKVKKAQQKYEENNPEKLKETRNKYLSNHPEKKLLKASKHNAKSRGLEHTITLEDIQIPSHCAYLGMLLTTTITGKFENSMASLDRIDNSKGYVSGNVEVISRLANVMKAHATPEQLITFATAILERYKCETL